MGISSKVGVIILASLLLTLSLLVACGSSGEQEKTPAQTATEEPAKAVTITIGFLSDMTGMAAGAMTVVNSGIQDLVEYYN